MTHDDIHMIYIYKKVSKKQKNAKKQKVRQNVPGLYAVCR